MDCVSLIERNTFWSLEAAEEGQCIPRQGRAWSDLGSYPSLLKQSCVEPSLEDGSTEAGDSCSERSVEDTDFDRLSEALPICPPGSFAAPPGVFAASGLDPTESRTTLLLRNLPSAFRQMELLKVLEDTGVLQHVDFLYVPTDFKTGAGLGYAFLNTTSAVQAQLAKNTLTGFSHWHDLACRKVLEVVWSSPHQGLDVLIAKYRNGRVMHPKVPDDFKPALFKNGVRVTFPKPTRRVNSPL